MLDGNGYTVQGNQTIGLNLTSVSNVTIKNLNIKDSNIYLCYSNNDTIIRNNVTGDPGSGFYLYSSNNNTISSSNIISNNIGINLMGTLQTTLPPKTT
jgi:parallel beta-helix repeat protein